MSAVAGTSTPLTHSPADDAPPHHRRRLLLYAVVLVVAFGILGVNHTIWAISVFLDAVFLAYFVRHLAFAISGARWAERDLSAANVGFDSYTPPVAVLVACKNEELVVDGMVSALLGLDYPADALTLVVVDDASDDGTGARLDAWADRIGERRVRAAADRS